mmetsp:Transcript_152213/g.270033  ORF Transcript_152213/g.270033 Transcript_152213/m.270033 type:complete len:333 (+) Transcript_152213:55-1053(+)
MATWEVVSERLLVRSGPELSSAAAGERLALGSIVRELQISGNRLHYELVSGSGPQRGWTAIRLRDRALLERKSGPVEDVVQDNIMPGPDYTNTIKQEAAKAEEFHEEGEASQKSGELQELGRPLPEESLAGKAAEQRAEPDAGEGADMSLLQLGSGFWRFKDRDGSAEIDATLLNLMNEREPIRGNSERRQRKLGLEAATPQAAEQLRWSAEKFEVALNSSVPHKQDSTSESEEVSHPGADNAQQVPNGSSLITGSLSGVGLLSAVALVEKGAKHITLASRGDLLHENSKPYLDMLKNTSAEVVRKRADVANPAQVKKLMQEDNRVPKIGRT